MEYNSRDKNHMCRNVQTPMEIRNSSVCGWCYSNTPRAVTLPEEGLEPPCIELKEHGIMYWQ